MGSTCYGNSINLPIEPWGEKLGEIHYHVIFISKSFKTQQINGFDEINIVKKPFYKNQ